MCENQNLGSVVLPRRWACKAVVIESSACPAKIHAMSTIPAIFRIVVAFELDEELRSLDLKVSFFLVDLEEIVDGRHARPRVVVDGDVGDAVQWNPHAACMPINHD